MLIANREILLKIYNLKHNLSHIIILNCEQST